MYYYSSKRKSTDRKYPCIVFKKDNWNDYGFVVMFNVFLFKTQSNGVEIGAVKILDRNTDSTTLRENFSELTVDQCSLGTDMVYYENLKRHLKDDVLLSVLRDLKDIALDTEIAEKFEDHDGFKNALLRFGASEKAFKDAKLLILYNERKYDDDLEFSFSVQLDGASDAHTVKFDFKKTDDLPYRVNVIIGKNGTGKTQFLGNLVEAIGGVKNRENFEPTVPLFNRVLAISYSLFDDFPKPKDSPRFSYKYIGIKDSDEEILNNKTLTKKLKASLKSILTRNRVIDFFDFLKHIINIKELGLNSWKDFNEEWIKKIDFKTASRLSSGQSIIFFILSELIAEIQEQSLILFDEPETHLHPSGVSSLMKCLYDILEKYNSFAVLSTHSAIILQDVPSQYVSVFDRLNDLPIIRRLQIECFGENISEITNNVFDAINVKEAYKEHLEHLTRQFRDIDNINEIFNNRLSFNALVYLTALENKDQ